MLTHGVLSGTPEPRYSARMAVAAADRLGILASNPFFGALPHADLALIAPLLREVSVPPGDFLVREGDRAVEVFIIDDGEVQVLKRHPGDGRLQEISRLGPGESVGELALIDEAPRSASVRAVRATRLYALSVTDVADAGAAAAIRTRLTQAVTRRLRDTNEVTVQALALQVAMGRSHVASRSISTTPISLGLSTLLIGVSFAMMRRLGYPLGFYGITVRGWRRALAEGVLRCGKAVNPDEMGRRLEPGRTRVLRDTGCWSALATAVSARSSA